MSETTPAIEGVSGPKLKQKYAEITLPEGWKRTENSGDGALVQGSSSFGSLTMSEINDGASGPLAPSLDALAKLELRVIDKPYIRRLDDAVIGEDTPAYRLAGKSGKNYYEEYYGLLEGTIEYSMLFSFYTRKHPVKEVKKTIDSMLATWTFNP